MKNLLLIFAYVLISIVSRSQTVQTIADNQQRSQYENSSYLIVQDGSLKLKPGFDVIGSQHAFYARAVQDVLGPAPVIGSSLNYMRTETILSSGNTTEAQVIGLGYPNKMTSYSYLDGLQRTLERISAHASPSGNDVVEFSYFDASGKPAKQYLPYSSASSNGGAFRTQVFTEQASFYNNPNDKVVDDARPYGDITFDNSPLNRVTKSIGTGIDWLSNNKSITNNFKLNDANTVRLLSLVNGLPSFSNDYYPLGTLTIQEVQDEEGAISRTYTDFAGHIILKQNLVSGSTWAETYYVYDVYGKVLFIIPPQAPAPPQTPISTDANTWYYQFQYDADQRLSGSKAPGAGWVRTLYDKWDRVVLRQDSIQRNNSQWTFVKYDELNRPIATGLYTSSTARSTLATQIATSTNRYETRTSTTAVGYTLTQTFPSAVENDLRTIAYYDDYGFLSNSGWDAEGNSYSPVQENGISVTINNSVKGQPTGGKVKILNGTTWLNDVTYYDDHYRPLQSISEHHLGGIQRVTNVYDFPGKVIKSLLTHISPTQQLKIQKRFDYDNVGRLLHVYHQTNSQPEIILKALEYNELGQVIDKKLYSTDNGVTYLQSLDYRYTITGDVSNVNYSTPDANDPAYDYFAEQLAYNTGFGTGSTNRYDGLYSALRWKDDISQKEKAYNFNYPDKSDRLGTANFQKYEVSDPSKSDAAWRARSYYDEGATYDLNGNITTLSRNGRNETSSQSIDQLGYTYSGNQLQRVTDSAPASSSAQGFNDGNTSGNDYQYDGNGNIISDLNKSQASISYNVLNKPDRVTFKNNWYIQYTYDASGDKLSSAYYDNNSQLQNKTDYVGSFMYLSNASQTNVLQMIQQEEGRIVPPVYANLIANTATREADTQEGFTASGSVTLSSQQLNGDTYVVATANQTGTPGIFPIGGAIAVKPGEGYTFNVLGYQSVGTTASLYVTDGSNNAIVWPGVVLPVGQANANWAKSTFIIPAGVTQIKVGVQWNGATIGNTIYINRVAVYKTDFEYQFYLNDRQGSPRVVLQTAPHTYTLTATMESENLGTESGQFQNMPNNTTTLSHEVALVAANVTPGGNEAYAMSNADPVGPARSFMVFPGDKIDASVSAYYTGGTFSKTPAATVAGYVITALAAGIQTTIDGINASYANSSAGGNTAFSLSQDQGTTKASAYLNYILFDDGYVPLEAKSQPVGAAGISLLTLPTITVKEKGYLYVYLSYDNAAGNNVVYFDDLKITVQESPVIQVNAYYPFGLPAYSWTRGGEQINPFLYQGKELDANAGWQDFGARMYYAEIGRWGGTDPAGQFASPYMAMGNRPMRDIDPDGRFELWDDALVFGIGFLVGDISYGVTHHGQFFSGKALTAGLVTGLTAEAGYLTFGGGLAAEGGLSSTGDISALAESAASSEEDATAFAGILSSSSESSASGLGLGTWENGVDFSILYGSGAGIDIGANSDQISGAKGWRSVWLIAGYSAIAAVSADFQTDYGEAKIDKIIDSNGVLSDAVGGAVHGAGDQVLKSYDGQNSWHVNWRDVGKEALLGAAQGGSNKLIGNGFDALADAAPEKGMLLNKANAKMRLLTPKEFGGVFGSQFVYNVLNGSAFDDKFKDKGTWVSLGTSWGRDYWKIMIGK